MELRFTSVGNKYMNLFTIQWASTNLPKEHRYIILNDGTTSAIYKRYLYIIYIRVSETYTNNEGHIKVFNKYNNLINDNNIGS